MKRSWCLLVASIIGFGIMCLNIVGELAFINAEIVIKLAWAATIFALAGFCFNAKPAAVLAGAVFAALSVIDNNPLVIYWVPCLLCFAGWSKIRHEEMDTLAFAMEEAVKNIRQTACAEPVHADAETYNPAVSAPAAQRTNVPVFRETAEEKFDVQAYLDSANNKSLKNWWYWLDDSVKYSIYIGAGVVGIIILFIIIF